jgi:trk system potassium uptake protein
MRQRFAVIGLGHFGAFALRSLHEAGKEVLAIDSDPQTVRELSAFATNAVTADATDRQALESLGLAEIDVVILSLGARMDVMMLAALHLREMGVPYIAAKAISEEHGRIMKALGVHEIVHPEKDSAMRLARRLAQPNLLEYLPLLPGYSIGEVAAPPAFTGKSLRDLALRNRLRVQLIAIRRQTSMNIMPRAEDVIERGDHLVLLGEDADLARIRELEQE